LRADPLVELANGEDEAAVFVEEFWCPGEFEGVVSYARQFAPKTEKMISKAQKRGAPAGTGGIEEIENALLSDVGGHGDFRWVESGKAGMDALGAGDYAADAGGDIVGALVAEDLEGHSGGDSTFEGGIIRVLGPLAGERSEKAAHGRAEAGASYIDFNGLTVLFRRWGSGWGGFRGLRGENWVARF
jgi:hypothetical protein